ncbi:MAG: hypothetical protein KJ623_00115 [Nanoarchaeota archaeon]|nr:hypothetical protein [Nanoarchaeota archaeon]MBU0963294.1 hypothetical protein [Nanoarchaeota archaeon]
MATIISLDQCTNPTLPYQDKLVREEDGLVIGTRDGGGSEWWDSQKELKYIAGYIQEDGDLSSPKPLARCPIVGYQPVVLKVNLKSLGSKIDAFVDPRKIVSIDDHVDESEISLKVYKN